MRLWPWQDMSQQQGMEWREPVPAVSGSQHHLLPQAIEIEERRIQSCVHFMTLKKLNRLAHIRLKKGRDQTHEVGVGSFFNPPLLVPHLPPLVSPYPSCQLAGAGPPPDLCPVPL